jgi:PAS domain S-box-containing protein
MGNEARTGDQLITELNQMRGKTGKLESRLTQATEPAAQWGSEHEMFQQDVEKKTQRENELGEAGRLYRSLVETAKDVIWTVDLDLRYTYMSPSVTEILGYTVEEIMASGPLDGLTPDSREKIINAFQEELALEASGPRKIYTSRTEEIERYHKDTSICWEQITTTFLRDEHGNPSGILGISRDITERKRMEATIHGQLGHGFRGDPLGSGCIG